MADVAELGIKVDSKQVLAGKVALDKLARSGKKAGKSAKGVGNSFKKVNPVMAAATKATKGLTVAFVALVAVMAERKIIEAGRKFTKAISNLAAITGATGKDLKFMTKAAKELGAQTTLSASQVAVAFKLIASAKPDLLESAVALKQVTEQAITLAEAASIDIPTAAKVLGTSLNQFGADANEAARFINVLAAGAKFGASEIEATAAALNKSAVVAKSAGISFEQLNATVQVLAASGVKAEIAGTGLKTILTKLQIQSNSNFNPAIVGIAQAFRNLAGANLSAEKQAKLFGLEALTVGKILIGGADSIDTFSTKLTDTNTALEQAATNVNNLDGDISKFFSALEGIQITLFDDQEGALRGLVQTLTTVLQITNDILETSFKIGTGPLAELVDPKLPKFKPDPIFGNSQFRKQQRLPASGLSATIDPNNLQGALGLRAKFDPALLNPEKAVLAIEQDRANAKQAQLEEALIKEESTKQAFRDAELNDVLIFEAKLKSLNDKNAKDEAIRIRKKNQLKLSMETALAGQVAGLIKQTAGGSKNALLAALAIEKAIAISRAIMNTAVSVTAANAVDPTGALAVKAEAIGTASIALIAASGVVEAIGIQGQADNGLAQVPRSGTFMLEKGERVVKKDDNKLLTQALQNGGFSGTTTVIVNVDATNSADVETVVRQAAEEGATLGYERVANDIRRGGPIRTAIA